MLTSFVMAPKKPLKPSAFSLFVADQCRLTGLPQTLGFTHFAEDWKDLDERKKEIYKEKAKCLKENGFSIDTIPEKICKPISTAPDPRVSRYKRHNDARDDFDSSEDEYEPDSGTDFFEADFFVQPLKKVFVGDDEGDYAGTIEVDPSLNEPRFDFETAKMTRGGELFKNVLLAYQNVNEITNQHVFVFSAVPVIYAQGFKKSAMLALNRPLEVAITAFRISDGVEDWKFHYFIHPGDIPVTSICHAIECRERHGLPYSPDADGDEDCTNFHEDGFYLAQDYYQVYKEMLGMVGYDGTNRKQLLPLFSASSEIGVNEACYRWLVTQAKVQAKERNLPKLPWLRFASLENFARVAVFLRMKDEPMPIINYNLAKIQSAFKKSELYRHIHAMNCPFHRVHSCTKVCALGAARESCYITLWLLKYVFKLPHDRRFVYHAPEMPEIFDDEIGDQEK